MFINKLLGSSFPVFADRVFLALLLVSTFVYSGFSVAQAESETAKSGLIPLTIEEMDQFSHQGLIFPDEIWPGSLKELNILEADIYIQGVSYGHTLTVNSLSGVKYYPLPDHIDQIVINNIRIGDDNLDSGNLDSSPPIGSATVNNINFQELNIIVSLD